MSLGFRGILLKKRLLMLCGMPGAHESLAAEVDGWFS